ncbi:MAG: hypothetical protein Q7R96_02420 [Nanoarchaeota archaeon]|nr:hypothetical protein [Nanoarchaeota archaeon]
MLNFYAPVQRLLVVHHEVLPADIGSNDPLFGRMLEPVTRQQYRRIVEEVYNAKRTLK